MLKCFEQFNENSTYRRTINCYDLRLITALRFWRRYITAVEGIVFVVDASNSHSLPEARQELNVSK